MKQILFSTFISLLLFYGCTTTDSNKGNALKVNPYIGSGGHGHVFVGANVPFGMVQLGPTNLSQGWDWCSGYHYSDSTIIGFAHTHLSGTGIGDLGDILFQPFVGQTYLNKGTPQNFKESYTSLFKHENETVQPGYYAVTLDKSNVKVELTATQRTGYHRYRYPENEVPQLLIDLGEGIGWDKVTESQMSLTDSVTIEGYRFSTGWAKDQKIYFVAQFSKPVQSAKVYQEEQPAEGVTVQGKKTQMVLQFKETEVLVRVGLSYTSVANAKENLQTETKPFGWDFNAVKENALALWNKQLDVINIQTADKNVEQTFYTALYHTMFFPSIFNDVNKSYRGSDAKLYKADNFDVYTVFSLWDTYRAAHPLFTLTAPEKINDFIQSFLAIYQQQGKVPVWHLVGNETDCMVGYHAIPVIVDAYLKGFRSYDVNLAYQAIKDYANLNERGLDFIRKQEYIPSDSQEESVARALEYAIDDAAIALMAKDLGKQEDYEYFSKRSKFYTHYFDPVTKFMRGKTASGAFRTPFDPIHSAHRADDYCEGNAWQYTWLVPHDPKGLVTLFGSEEAMIQKLDSLFIISSELGESASVDITGLIGQYAHGNEPSHHTLFLYNYLGQPWKAQKLIREVLTTLYFNDPNGLAGNEDCGQMSAWYVFNALGLYPANAANGQYLFGSPIVNRATINLPNNLQFTIEAQNNSTENIYIQSATLNGQPYTKSYITHQELTKGGTLTFVMGNTPNTEFGKAPEDRPFSE